MAQIEIKCGSESFNSDIVLNKGTILSLENSDFFLRIASFYKELRDVILHFMRCKILLFF